MQCHPPVCAKGLQTPHRTPPNANTPRIAACHHQHQHRRLALALSSSLSASASGATTSGTAVLVQDGVLAASPPATAQQLLSQHRGWSYTTALVRRQHHVVDWELHIQRLIRNMEVLARQRSPAYAGFAAWRQQQADEGNAVADALQQLLNPMVAAALHQLYSDSSNSAPSDGQQAMLTVALGDKQSTSPPAASRATAASAQCSEPPVSVLVWAKAVPPAAFIPAKVLVAGDPRPAAQAKHCDWVVARQPLEQLKQQAGVDEVVLSDSGGALLEGLVSNFYVVADAAQLAALGQPVGGTSNTSSSSSNSGSDSSNAARQQQPQQQQASPTLSGLVLLTTGPAADALLGVTQQRVLQACQAVGLPLVLQPAAASSAPAWREAFLTNCIKGIQAVQEVQLADGTVWTAPAPATATPALQAAMASLQTETDMSRWT